ncbi:MAG: RluA family pseudouridine synthase [Clostridia bacterium]|nr:RluA family pseudouridine synthase [Clostridia bacterium]
MKEFIIGKNDAGQRLDKFITKAIKEIPQSLMYKSIRTKKIKINRKRAEVSQILNEGDTVQVFLSDDLFADTGKKAVGRSDVKVVYEDDNIILCDKEPGLCSQPDDEGGEDDCLINRIISYLIIKGEFDPQKENSFIPALCNRIDRNTGGLVIAAKNAEALRIMNSKIKNREIEKKYLCVVHGKFGKEKSGKLVGYMKKNEKENSVNVYDKRFSDDMKTMISYYKVLREIIVDGNDYSLLEVRLETGRTHQIRAQMAHCGHPLLGDGKYGINKDDRKMGFRFQALYSYKLKFDFSSDSGILGYLDKKIIEIPPEKINFVKKLFNDMRIDN